MPKINRTIRIDPELLEKAKNVGLDLTSVVEAAIVKALKENRCHYCKQEIRRSK